MVVFLWYVCPEVFELDEEGKVQVREGAKGNENCIKEVKEGCPVKGHRRKIIVLATRKKPEKSGKNFG